MPTLFGGGSGSLVMIAEMTNLTDSNIRQVKKILSQANIDNGGVSLNVRTRPRRHLRTLCPTYLQDRFNKIKQSIQKLGPL
jgi:hypothetical protein